MGLPPQTGSYCRNYKKRSLKQTHFVVNLYMIPTGQVICQIRVVHLVAYLLRDEELLHGHVVHGGEVLLHQLLAVLPLSATCKLMSELKLVKFTY